MRRSKIRASVASRRCRIWLRTLNTRPITLPLCVALIRRTPSGASLSCSTTRSPGRGLSATLSRLGRPRSNAGDKAVTQIYSDHSSSSIASTGCHSSSSMLWKSNNFE